MKNYGTTYAATEPQPVVMTNTSVFVASDIQPSTLVDHHGNEIANYSYTLIEYTKDEYLMLIAQQNAELAAELAATKILLGVE